MCPYIPIDNRQYIIKRRDQQTLRGLVLEKKLADKEVYIRSWRAMIGHLPQVYLLNGGYGEREIRSNTLVQNSSG